MNYKNALKYLDSFTDYEKLKNYEYNEVYFDLNKVRKIFSDFSNPQNNFRTVHIAGTKGKGSTAAILSYILASAGYRVGLYTSPHLIDFRERIKIIYKKDKKLVEEEISPEEVIEIVKDIKSYLNKNKSSFLPTTFELYTLTGFLYFSKKPIDILVVEVGMGGRLDATNIVENPLVCIITSISLDHTAQLGNKLSKIAYEKAGIIKRKTSVVSAPQKKSVEKVLKKKAEIEKAKIYFLKNNDYKINYLTAEGSNFDFKNSYKDLFLSLAGEHQIENASLAIECVEILKKKGIRIDKSAVKSGLKNVRWPGRLQILKKNPYIVVDGAHNQASAKVLRKSLKLFSYKNLFLIMGMFSDKNIFDFLKEFYKVSQRIIISRVKNPRSADPEDIEKQLADKNKIIKVKDLKEGIKIAKSLSSKKDLILITGSLYLVGEALKIIRN